MSKNVLIADDSASMRRSVRFLLERRHSELMVSEAVDGVDAIEKAKETKPDLGSPAICRTPDSAWSRNLLTLTECCQVTPSKGLNGILLSASTIKSTLSA